MQKERIVMGMPAKVELVGTNNIKFLDQIFDLWDAIENRFSIYKTSSEIMRINRGELKKTEYSQEMKEVLFLADETKLLTNGYFNIKQPNGLLDPSGLVKGWAIQKAAELAQKLGFDSYYLEIGGDIQTRGYDEYGRPWSIGIRNPFNRKEIVKVLYPKNAGVATSGTAERGQHIYNPYNPKSSLSEIVSITVIGPNVYEADRFATAAFAMGRDGIFFINSLEEFEAYAIDKSGIATMTDGIDKYLTL